MINFNFYLILLGQKRHPYIIIDFYFYFFNIPYLSLSINIINLEMASKKPEKTVYV
jgi:hypothetical protein